MKNVYVLVCVMCFSLGILADDAFTRNYAGGLRLASDCTSIRLFNKRTEITLDAGEYNVLTACRIENLGGDTSVTITFPVRYGGIVYDTSLLKSVDFVSSPRVWVDDVLREISLSHTKLVCRNKGEETVLTDELSITAFEEEITRSKSCDATESMHRTSVYTFSITLLGSGSHSIRMQYQARYGERYQSEIKYIPFEFSSCSSSKDRLGPFELVIRSSPSMWVYSYPDVPASLAWCRKGEYLHSAKVSDMRLEQNTEMYLYCSSVIPPFLNEFGILQPPISTQQLSLCSEKQLNALSEIIKSSTDFSKSDALMVDAYRKSALLRNFCHDVKEGDVCEIAE